MLVASPHFLAQNEKSSGWQVSQECPEFMGLASAATQCLRPCPGIFWKAHCNSVALEELTAKMMLIWQDTSKRRVWLSHGAYISQLYQSFKNSFLMINLINIFSVPSGINELT